MWVAKCWCGCDSMCSCVVGCVPACWTPFCWLVSAACVPWYVLRSNTGLPTHGNPYFCPPNQNLARVRPGGGVPSVCHVVTTTPPPSCLCPWVCPPSHLAEQHKR